MKIRLDLAGELEDALDPAIVDSYSLGADATVADLLKTLPFADRIALTSVNGEMVPPAARAGHRLADGDEVMLLPAIKGG